MHFEFSVVLLYLTICAVIVGIALWLGRFLRPSLPDAQKSQIYECGERPIGSAWFNFNPRFYLIALVFIVFDAEIALTFPVATVARDWIARADGSGWVAVVEIFLFFVILVAALAYIWGKGELDWSRELTPPEEMP